MSSKTMLNKNENARINLLIYGAGGHAKVVLDAALKCEQFNVVALVSDLEADWGQTILGLPVKSPGDYFPSKQKYGTIIGIGDNKVRAKIFDRIANSPNEIHSLIHPAAIISPFAKIGKGSFVSAKAVLQADCVIGSNVIINTAAIIEHDCAIDRNAHISPGAILAGNVRIGSGSWVGAGAVVKEKVSIGKNVIIGAGAVVIRDVPDGLRMAGVPAREI